ncbi:Imm51 family immunity protein [Actinomadura oligospora]|uniref:Imm51 family immunity protein n=1 Tax=Actinomadura oligospora TaxID=111804 RepID=UPI00047A9C98|nr:Imm51 family immunity protein [Actinomadura oligospora]
MTPLKLIETSPGSFSLLLNAGTTQVDALVEQHGHEPNGYFWEGVARFLVTTEAPSLEGRFSYDPEAGMFCAYGRDRPALEELATLLAPTTTTPTRMTTLLKAAQAANHDFDD